jgi:hypothetical protein
MFSVPTPRSLDLLDTMRNQDDFLGGGFGQYTTFCRTLIRVTGRIIGECSIIYYYFHAPCN